MICSQNRSIEKSDLTRKTISRGLSIRLLSGRNCRTFCILSAGTSHCKSFKNLRLKLKLFWEPLLDKKRGKHKWSERIQAYKNEIVTWLNYFSFFRPIKFDIHNIDHLGSNVIGCFLSGSISRHEMSYRCHVRRHEVMFGGSGCVVLLQDRNYGRWWRKYEITHRKNSYFFCQKNLWLSSHRQPSTADFILISLDDVRNITAPIWVNHYWKKRHSWTPDLYSDNYFRKWKSASREAENPWQILFVLSASFNGKNFIDLVRT